MNSDDDEIERLRTGVDCAVVLERAGWRKDMRESTRNAPKYRNEAGDIIIVSHRGRGWWDPQMTPRMAGAQGDVFALVQRLNPAMNFGHVRKVLRGLLGLTPIPTQYGRQVVRSNPLKPPPHVRWACRPFPSEGSAVWRYLADIRALPSWILNAAIRQDALRAGPHGSAWFAHRDNDGVVTGWEMKSATFRGFPKAEDGAQKIFFRLKGEGQAHRIVVTEAAIDTLSYAALDGLRADTLYLATTGGFGPAAIDALHEMLDIQMRGAGATLIAATDPDKAGERYAAILAGVGEARAIPVIRHVASEDGDWNDLLRSRRNAASDRSAPHT
jgi:hypothetical protein